ncbi:hypothetical protein MKEN_00276100 [Mycena kentingensis (nom. inval.)]|nr:hypothetical protein MKEN_00276100 [Mycena kentingensis (nom. inval.)]
MHDGEPVPKARSPRTHWRCIRLVAIAFATTASAVLLYLYWISEALDLEALGMRPLPFPPRPAVPLALEALGDAPETMLHEHLHTQQRARSWLHCP